MLLCYPQPASTGTSIIHTEMVCESSGKTPNAIQMRYRGIEVAHNLKGNRFMGIRSHYINIPVKSHQNN